MKSRAALAFLWLLLACEKTAPEEVIRTSFKGFPATHHCMEWQGVERCYYVVPPKEKPKHLLVALHPAFTPVQIAENVSRLAANLVPKGYLVVYPEGIDRQWNDGRVMTAVKTYNDKTDDVGFVDAVTQTIQKQYGFSPAQTTVAGMSNGGMMSQRLACQSERYGSMATVVANLPLDLRKHCKATPKPAMLVFGADDAVVLHAGGPLAKDGQATTWGAVESARDTEQFFITRNGCQPDHVKRRVIADPQLDRTRAVIREYEQCAAPLTVISVEHMGHTWPGEASRFWAWLSMRGAVSQQFGAAQAIDGFISRGAQ